MKCTSGHLEIDSSWDTTPKTEFEDHIYINTQIDNNGPTEICLRCLNKRAHK